jgi:DNA-binding transcriptional regulator LsrR (DeoR family)
MISRALAEKIVQIKINIPDDPAGELEQKLEVIYGLKEAVVIQVASENILEDLGEVIPCTFFPPLNGTPHNQL